MRKADELLQNFINRIGASDGAPYVSLFSGWREVVGDRIADHAQPVDVRASALIIEADHPAWVQMVMLEQARIINQLSRRYPELSINSLHVRVATPGARNPAPAADPGNAGRRRIVLRPEDPATNAEAPSEDEGEALGKLEDDDLRKSLESLRDALREEDA